VTRSRRFFRQRRRYLLPLRELAARRAHRRPSRQPRIRPRKTVSVASLVGSPEERPSRPSLRLNVIALVVFGLFAVMVLRLWTLQVIDHRNYAAAVNANGLRVVAIPAPRGDITDRNGVVLVGNQVSQELVLSRVAAAQHPSVIGAVAALVGKTPAQVEAILKDPRYSPFQPVPVMTDAPPATVTYLQEHPEQFPGVSVQALTERAYPQGDHLASHVLGYVGDITGTELAAHPNQGYTPESEIGKTGVEAEYEQFLRGVAGQQELEVNAKGTVVGTLHRTDPVQGDTVVLNIDVGLQRELEQALENQILTDRRTPDVKNGGRFPPAPNGAAIVLDPSNGHVLALASYPSFDLTQFVGGISQAAYDAIQRVGAENDYAIDGLYTPGSTFKLVTATAALQKGIISPNQYVDDTGTFTVPGCTGGTCVFHNDDSEALGPVDLPEALTASDDYYFYNLGAMFWQQQAVYGPQPIQDVGAQYGLTTPTGIDLPGEGEGRIDSPTVRKALHAKYPKAFPYDTWYTGDNVEMAFGQGGTVLTPIGLADAYATFANGGTRYAPEVAAEVVSPQGKVIERYQPRVTGHVDLPPSVRDPMLQGFEGVVSSPSGTAYQAFQGFPLAQFPLAGKTGTASNAPGLEPNSWFVAFGPLPNPRYLVLAVISQGGYGAAAAAPVVRQAFDWIYANQAQLSAAPSAGAATASGAGGPVAASPGAGRSPATARGAAGSSATTAATTTTAASTTGSAPATTAAPAQGRRP